MALPWTKPGEKIVKAPGIIEIRWKGDDPSFARSPIDLFDKQDDGLDETYGKKDKKTGIQNYFYCFLCECELMSIKTLRLHSTGNQHLVKAYSMEAKYKKTQKKEEDIKQDPEDSQYDLYSVLEKQKKAIVGLKYITEFTCQNKMPLYHCKLIDCKNETGNAGHMSRHIFTVGHRAAWVKNDQNIHHLITTDQVCSFVQEKREDLERVYDQSITLVPEKRELYNKVRDGEYFYDHEKDRKRRNVERNADALDVKKFKPDPSISVPGPSVDNDIAADTQEDWKNVLNSQTSENTVKIKLEDWEKTFKHEVVKRVTSCLNKHWPGTAEYVPHSFQLSADQYRNYAKTLGKQLRKELVSQYQEAHNGDIHGLYVTPEFDSIIKTRVAKEMKKIQP